MNYGKGAAPVTGVAILPFTGNNDILFIAAASLIALGVVVFIVSLVAHKRGQVKAN